LLLHLLLLKLGCLDLHKALKTFATMAVERHGVRIELLEDLPGMFVKQPTLGAG